ncbi:MAG: hypothetical protein AAF244_00060 [Pseudomonadota bacterium]
MVKSLLHPFPGSDETRLSDFNVATERLNVLMNEAVSRTSDHGGSIKIQTCDLDSSKKVEMIFLGAQAPTNAMRMR